SVAARRRASKRLRCALAGGSAGDLAKDGTVHQAGAARIVEIEQPAHQLAGRKQPGDRRAISVDDAGGGVDLDAAEGEGEPAGHRISLERRLIEGVGPV